jgi:hypothetical protein
LNWDALGAIAESVGAIGVIATLLYLAAQIRANTRSVRASTYQETERGGREVNLALAQDAELSRIWSSGLLDFDTLAHEEKLRFAYVATLYLREFQNAKYQCEQGTLDKISLDQWRQQLRVICALPGFATWWDRNELYRFSPTFEELVGQFVEEGKRPAA